MTLKHVFALAAALALSGCQLFVDFDRDLIDGGDDASSMRIAPISDAGVDAAHDDH